MMDTLIGLVEQLYDKKPETAYAALKQLEAHSLTSKEGYVFMDTFLSLLKETNSYLRTRGIRLCAAYAVWDDQLQLDHSIDTYLALLHDDSVICTRKCIQYLPLIIQAKPSLIPIIHQALLTIDLTRYKPTMQPLLQQDLQKVFALIPSGKEYCHE